MVDKLTPHEYKLISQATDNLTANKIQQALNAASAVGTVTSVNSGTDIVVDNTDPANPIINYSGAAGAGDVVGGATSTDGEIARYNLATGKLIKASATPVIVSDAGDVTLPAARTVFSSTFRSISSNNTSLLADSGGEVIINDSGNNAANLIGVDLSGTGGYIKLKDGAAAGVAIGNSATNGVIFGVNTVSIVTNGVEKWMVNSSGSLNPILDNTYDIGNGAVNPRDITVSRNLITDNIVEKTLNAGVNFPNDIYVNDIKDNGAHMTIDQTFATGRITLQTASGFIALNSGDAVNIETGNNGDLQIVVNGTGVVQMNGSPTHTGTVDTAVTPNLVFENGLLMSAS